MDGPLAGLAPLLTVVRAWAPVCRRWWEHARIRGVGAAQPWSGSDDDQLGRLRGFDPGWLESAAARLDRLGEEAAAVAALVAGATSTTGAAPVTGAGSAVGGAVDGQVLAARAEQRAREADVLATGMRAAAVEVEAALQTMVRRVLQAADGVGLVPDREGGHGVLSYPKPVDAHDDIDRIGADRGGHARREHCGGLDEMVEQHAAVVRALRGELTRALDDLHHLTGGRGPTGWVPESAWCPGDSGCPAEVWTRWQPGSTATGPEPGSGPLIPDTGARRAGPDEGVRIAELPDGVSG